MTQCCVNGMQSILRLPQQLALHCCGFLRKGSSSVDVKRSMQVFCSLVMLSQRLFATYGANVHCNNSTACSSLGTRHFLFVEARSLAVALGSSVHQLIMITQKSQVDITRNARVNIFVCLLLRCAHHFLMTTPRKSCMS